MEPPKLQQKDFVEIEFTGKIKDGDIFDSNIKEDLEKANINVKAKPFIFRIGEGMFLKGVEDFLIGKEFGKKYELELTPENAFGNRNSKLIQIMPIKIFMQQKINPVPGAVFNFDGRIAKILSVSGGRVIVDFNNPMAGKTVFYRVNPLRKVEDLNEKIESFINFLFKRDLKFEVKDKKIIIEVEKAMVKFVELFKEKFKDIFDMNLEVRELSEKSKIPDKKESKKQ